MRVENIEIVTHSMDESNKNPDGWWYLDDVKKTAKNKFNWDLNISEAIVSIRNHQKCNTNGFWIRHTDIELWLIKKRSVVGPPGTWTHKNRRN